MDPKALKDKAISAIESAPSAQELEEILRAYLGKKGELTIALKSIASLPEPEKQEVGKALNSLRDTLEQLAKNQKTRLLKEEVSLHEEQEFVDMSSPGTPAVKGSLHPLTQTQQKVKEIFSSMGFSSVTGPELEQEWYNFSALNVPENHPSKDMQDTLWLKEDSSKKLSSKEPLLMRTHTSAVQIRYMEKHKPPFRIIAQGRVFRNEATDARHEINFYQVEGLMIDKNITVANFRAVLQEFFRKFFGSDNLSLRLRPSFFPFTEPSFEVDMKCGICQGKKSSCSTCGGSGWLEILGAGIVHPQVLKNVNINPRLWQGFAFGMSIERLTMMKYHIDDIRMFYGSDIRFLSQFS
ncbi:MAG: phenylalanine--tRNA ligase subunit alpha [bacterium]|nr:phenylalanine--tRNA ligase subunit alpha [bacterium]